MAETHLLQNIIPFALAIWWTKGWLMDPIIARWRFAVSGLAGSILWVYVAYTSTAVQESSGGVVIEYSNLSLAYFAAFMAVVSVVGVLLGLVLWTEESLEDRDQNLPEYLRSEME